MAAISRVFAGVTIRRAVAAQGDAALLTGAQVNPFRADLNALGALRVITLFDRQDGVEM